jgi:hypothetical protein
MYAKLGHFIDIDLYKETFESNLNKGELAVARKKTRNWQNKQADGE